MKTKTKTSTTTSRSVSARSSASAGSAASVVADYPLVQNRPVAKFRYKGTHSKAIRRTVLLTEINRDMLRGYEVREGNEVRSINDQVIKSFTREDVQDLARFAITTNSNW